MRIRKAHLTADITIMTIMTAIAIAFFSLSFSGPVTAADASLKDDAYHYLHNGIDDRLYNEWWYFNGVANDTQFSMIYLLSDPENLTGLRKLQVTAVVMEDGKPARIGIHQSRGFGGDKDGPTVDIDQSGLSYQDESNFRIWGAVEDISTGQPIKWDLSYESASSPWFATPVQSHVGHLKGDWMKWLVYMPSARVSGTLSLDNETREIEAAGYHDHNWGRWALNDPLLNMAQVTIPKDGFSLVLGDMTGEQRNTVLGVNYAGDTIKFSGKQIELNYTDFALDQLTSRIYPTGYTATASNGDYRLNMNISVIKNVPLLTSYPSLMPSYITFEQVALFNGTLRSKAGENYQFEDLGFVHYATHRLHPVFGRVNATGAENDADFKGNDIIVTAINERTGQVKTAKASQGIAGQSGSFSFDADYADYLADSAKPWVADGDIVRIEAKDATGRHGNNTIAIDMAEDAQDVGEIELS